jgi:D-alanyl-D-alanine carboxypeptidase
MYVTRLVGAAAFALATWTSAATPAAQGDPAFSADMQRQMEAAARRDLAAYGGAQPVPGVVLGVWYPSHGSFVKGIGYGDLSPRRAMALDDRFRIGSNTKTFVNTVILQLVDEKRLGLDDRIDRFKLPVTVPRGGTITVRELMEMRSGIIDLYASPAFQKLNIGPHDAFDLKHWTEVALAHAPLFAPGTKYNYSNTNYMLLGWIVEAVTHDTVAHQIRKRLIGPLGLTATTFPVTDPNMPTPYARGYSLDAKTRWVDESVVFPPNVAWAAGAMISDMADMKKWVKAYVTGTTNGAATQKARLTCLPIGEGNLSFGLGIGCSAGWYGYTGGITGYNTGAYYMPATGATIIAFVNSQRETPSPGVANSIFRDIAHIITPTNVPFVK